MQFIAAKLTQFSLIIVTWGYNCQKLTKCTWWKSIEMGISNPERDFHDINAHTIWWKSIDIYSTWRPDHKIMDLSRADNSVKTWWHLPTSNPKPDLLSLVKNHWYLLKLLSGNKKSDMLQADNTVKNGQNLPSSNPKLDFHNIYAHASLVKIYWHSLTLSGGNENTDGRKLIDVRQTNGCKDVQTHGWFSETIIPHHYHVAGYKKGCNSATKVSSKKICQLFHKPIKESMSEISIHYLSVTVMNHTKKVWWTNQQQINEAMCPLFFKA